MTLDEQLTRAMQHVADEVIVPDVDLAALRSRARAHRIRVASLAGTAAVVLVLAAATALVGGRDTSAPQPASTPTSSVPDDQPSTTSLLTFTSARYDVTLRYPLGWSAYAARRDWSWTTDVRDPMSPGHDWFLSPESSLPDHGDVRVTVWAAPVDPETRTSSTADLVAWAEDYCTKSGNSPCTGIAERAVELCLEKPACRPGLLVEFKEDVQAFVSGADPAQDAMTIVAVWRPEWDESVRPYGGSKQLLESFLATLEVQPNTTRSRP